MNLKFSLSGRAATLLLTALGLSAPLTLSAAEPFPYDGTLLPNVEYTYEKQDLSAVFIPSATGEIMYNCGSFIRPYYDADHTTIINNGGNFLGYMPTQTYSLNVTEGTPIYFYASKNDLGWMSDQIFMITENKPIEILGYTIEEGGVLSLTSGYTDLLVYFNQPVAASQASIRPEGSSTSVSIPVSSTPATTLAFPYTEVVKDLLSSGAASEGQKLILTIKGIATSAGVAYNDGKDLVLTYVAPSIPVTLVIAEFPDPFMGYWKEGEADGIAHLEYSGDLSKVQYLLKYGDFESETPDGYIEVGESNDPESLAKVTIDGNNVSIDFTGVRRSPKFMVPSGTDYSEITLKVTAWDKYGEPVAGSGQGMVGSYERVLSYVYYPPANYRATFTPASGESLKDHDYLYLHLYDYHTLRFNEVKFEIEVGASYIVPKSEITETGGSEFDWTLSIPVPEAVKTTSSKVNVTFPDAEFLDGEDHADEFTALYNNSGSVGIEAVSSEDSLPAIYSIEGRRIHTSDFETLCPGLYIVNGNKVIIK